MGNSNNGRRLHFSSRSNGHNKLNMSNKNEFEEYLRDVHAEDYIGTDDDMPDAFEGWLENMGIDLLLAHGDKFGTLMKIKAVKEFGAVSKGLTEDDAMEREHELEIDQMKDAEDKNLERLSDNFGNGGQY